MRSALVVVLSALLPAAGSAAVLAAPAAHAVPPTPSLHVHLLRAPALEGDSPDFRIEVAGTSGEAVVGLPESLTLVLRSPKGERRTATVPTVPQNPCIPTVRGLACGPEEPFTSAKFGFATAGPLTAGNWTVKAQRRDRVAPFGFHVWSLAEMNAATTVALPSGSRWTPSATGRSAGGFGAVGGSVGWNAWSVRYSITPLRAGDRSEISVLVIPSDELTTRGALDPSDARNLLLASGATAAKETVGGSSIWVRRGTDEFEAAWRGRDAFVLVSSNVALGPSEKALLAAWVTRHPPVSD